MKKMEVNAINNGTVIDHIPSESVFKVVKILGLMDCESMILIGTNLDSQKLGKKGIIKVKDKFFKKDEINKISLVAPEATLIVINDYTVVEKYTVKTPKEVVGIAQCFNPKCITNHEEITTQFDVVFKGNEIMLKCGYCEKVSEKDNITIL